MSALHDRVAARCCAGDFPVAPAAVAEIELLLEEERQRDLALPAAPQGASGETCFECEGTGCVRDEQDDEVRCSFCLGQGLLL